MAPIACDVAVVGSGADERIYILGAAYPPLKDRDALYQMPPDNFRPETAKVTPYRGSEIIPDMQVAWREIMGGNPSVTAQPAPDITAKPVETVP